MENSFKAFWEEHTTIKVGVVGYSDKKFDREKALEMIKKAFDIIGKKFPDNRIMCVSGLTDLGIPGIAYHEAKSRGWQTMGVACEKAEQHKCFPVDKKKIVGKEWGDESKTFLGELDVLIRVGGGKQSLKETAEAKKRGLKVYEFDLPEAK